MRTKAELLHRPRRRASAPDEFPFVIRPISPADGHLLLDGFDRLSDESRRLRFLGAKTVLTSREVSYLTDVDHRDHEALVALDLAGRGAGVARYVRDQHFPDTAEVAVVVVDVWQRRRVGSQLLTRLAERALAEGIRCFTAIMADDNVAILGLLRSLGARLTVTGAEFGAVRLALPVASIVP